MSRLIFLYVALLILQHQEVRAQTDSAGVSELFDMPFENLLNAKVYASAKYQQSTEDAPASISVITAEEIKHYGYQTLDQLLMAQKGFYVSNDRNYSYLGSRGFSRPSDYNNRIILLLDGNKLNENVYGQGFFGSTLSLNLEQIERVEIIRGTGSALYGSGAMVGVINIITKSGAAIDGWNLKAGYGSYRKKMASGLYGTSLGSGIDLSLSFMGGSTRGQDLYYEELDNPDNNNGLSIGKDWERQYGFNMRASGKHLSLHAYHANRTKGIPTGAWNMLLTGDNKTQDIRSFIGLEYARQFNGNQSIHSRAYYNDYVYLGKYQMNGWDEFDRNIGRWAGFDTEYHWKWGQRNTMIAGIEYVYNFRADYTYWVDEDLISDNNFPYSYFSIYLQDEYKITDHISFWSSLRLDKHSDFSLSLSPRFALIAKPLPASVIKFIYSSAFRSPNVYESRVEITDYLKLNPYIIPERINIMEVAWEQKFGSNVSSSLGIYHFKMRELIDQELDPVDENVQFVNREAVFGLGSEFEIRAVTKHNSQGYLNMTVQKALHAESGLEVSNSPNIMLKAGWSQPVFEHLRISPELMYETSRLTIYDTRTTPFLLANINFRTGTFLNYFDAGLKIQNLFNTTYQYPGGYELVQDAILQPGINFLLQLNAKF